jgi:hypothetical protein
VWFVQSSQATSSSISVDGAFKSASKAGKNEHGNSIAQRCHANNSPKAHPLSLGLTDAEAQALERRRHASDSLSILADFPSLACYDERSFIQHV